MTSAKFPVVCEAHGGTRRNFGQRVRRPMNMIFSTLIRSFDDLFEDMLFVLNKVQRDKSDEGNGLVGGERASSGRDST